MGVDWIKVAQDVYCEAKAVGRCLPGVGDTSGSCVQTSSTLESDWRAITECLAPGPPAGSADTCWVRPALCDRSRKVPLISCNTQNRYLLSRAILRPQREVPQVGGMTPSFPLGPCAIRHRNRSALRYWLATF
jgi:hypothetical protein